jgi:hypothetical protein
VPEGIIITLSDNGVQRRSLKKYLNSPLVITCHNHSTAEVMIQMIQRLLSEWHKTRPFRTGATENHLW